ncbi:RluA family pseudouridine synthase [Paenibacillus mendelii]|uniref:Pseudouridine synthase n=1 Tax=Paenibacillus mendelii TaxID=206163 RepID=A0ABV6JA51_9BACL|nr:RluA family pseudouridine synthase [Paenibacillus mendelii]MCQ6560850.1 RluA family pseudouridine synthase [Paenibacillus mendelii]
MFTYRSEFTRNRQWLEIPLEALNRFEHTGIAGVLQPLGAGSHPHDVRQRLLALAVFPAKWINRLFSVGGIRIENGIVGLRTFVPVDIEAEPIYQLAQLKSGDTAVDHVPVLYEDDWCLVFDKPTGMPVHPNAPRQRGTLDEAAARHCLQTGDALPVKHIHRLDDDTAGPVLYAKNDLAQMVLDEAMRDKRVDRQYEALVHGKPAKSRGTINEPIGKDRHHGARRRVTPTGDHAVTHYETLAVYKSASLLRLQLETGRTHQIRVHLSHAGYPIVGDQLYGGRVDLLRHQALRGERLLFPHPLTGLPVMVNSVEPDWFRALRQKLSVL